MQADNNHKKNKSDLSDSKLMLDKTKHTKKESCYKKESDFKSNILLSEKLNDSSYQYQNHLRVAKDFPIDIKKSNNVKFADEEKRNPTQNQEKEIHAYRNDSMFLKNFIKGSVSHKEKEENKIPYVNNNKEDKKVINIQNIKIHSDYPSKFDESRNTNYNRINKNITVSEINQTRTENLMPAHVTRYTFGSRELKDKFQKYLTSNKLNENFKKLNLNENNFSSQNTTPEFREEISTPYRERIFSFDEKTYFDYNSNLKKLKETGDSYKNKMTNTHSTGNASNHLEDYKNIKFENVEETHFINLYILQSSRQMIKIQERISEEKDLFRTVKQIEDEIDL